MLYIVISVTYTDIDMFYPLWTPRANVRVALSVTTVLLALMLSDETVLRPWREKHHLLIRKFERFYLLLKEVLVTAIDKD